MQPPSLDTDEAPPRVTRRRVLGAAGLGAAALAAAAAGWQHRPSASDGRGALQRPRPTSVADGYAVPVDTAPHTRTWMAWPDSTAIWGRRLPGLQADIAVVATTIARYEPVFLCANAGSAAQARRACGPSVTVIDTVPVDDCWMRDMGPVFRVDGSGRLDVVGTNFNGWGGKQTHVRDAEVASRVAAHVGVPFTAADFVGEGGAIESDGAGTLMATRSSLVNSNRNPGKREQELERAMCSAYGASKVIWFPGLEGHDITDDHVDATSRFLSPVAALVQLPPQSESDLWATDARQQHAILSQATNAAGDPIQVSRLRGPDYGKIRSTSRGFVASYANYYVCNGAVVTAQFGDAATDAAARHRLATLFPGRAVEQLAIDSIGAGGGGIHCVTQQQPGA